ncbi:PIR protein [Plasmodium vivax]|uniref:VIR protein n=1 Tax=Plasmodium vivax TaxID=5855 RepID=A0A565A494_PLAVI|nr:PIR protein [Plasmodium vivax]
MADCDNELKGYLFTYSQYNILNKSVDVNDQNVECENFSKELPKYRNFKNLCHKLSRNIKNVCIFMREPSRKREPSLEEEQSQKKVHCDNLNYWLYYILIKSKLLDNEENISNSEIFKVLPKLWDSTDCNQTCKLEHYNMNTNDFVYMKELYDYSKNYKNIEYYTSNPDYLDCKIQYCSYINKVEEIYKKVEQICSSPSDKPYCTIYNDIPAEKNPSEFFSKIRCTKDDVDESLVEDAKIFGTEFQSLAYDLGDSFPISNMASKQDLPGEPSQQLSVGLDQSTSTQSPSNNSAKVGLSLFGMSSIPLFLIYKFTPGGNFIRKLIRKNSGSMSTLDNMRSENWLGLSPEYQNDALQNKRFEVLYQAMKKP